jgi:ectoine hydroxylase-related dioxygenase (phytanoyl-CoA dioxygenase family)
MKHDPARWNADYQRDGYLVVEDLVDRQTLEQLRCGIEAITADPDNLPPRLKRHCQFERDYVRQQPKYNDLKPEQVGNALRNIMELPLFDPLFARFIGYEPLLDVLDALFQSAEFHFHNYKCIIKAPKVSSVFRWHRDLPYLKHSTSNLITAMICLDDMTEQNGATVVLPGSHRMPEAELQRPEDAEIEDADLPPGYEKVSVCCPAGSAVLFHVNLIHGGPGNRSPHPRRNVIGIWAGPDTYPITASRYAYQGLYPRSSDPARRRQVELALP